jgi:uncharacterized protein (DUF1501 family)
MFHQFIEQSLTWTRGGVVRRSFLKSVAAGSAAAGALSFRDAIGVQAGELKKQGMSLILLWMQGGPSHLETFDPKPGTTNGGPTEAIDTAVPGIRIAEGWNGMARVMSDVAIIRGMTNKEGQHQRATYQLHTGYVPTGTVRHPSLGCAIAKEISPEEHDLPAVVSVGGTVGAGFLGVDYEPFNVGDPGKPPRNVTVPVEKSRLERRLGLLGKLDDQFAARGGEAVVASHKSLYEKTRKLVVSPSVKAFEFTDETPETLAAYGDSQFGRGCLLARRLVDSGVTFVEVVRGGWDTHEDNFGRVKTLAGQVDPGASALIADLRQRGMLDRTLVVWMGEFGRTPKINPRVGRDHYPRVFNLWLAGGGVKGGQVIGSSTHDATAVKDRPVTVPDLFCSICHALKVDPRRENISPVGRPLKIVDGGETVKELFA